MNKTIPTPQEIDLCVSNLGATKGRKYSLAILPWGATEPHNYHLPYLTDCGGKGFYGIWTIVYGAAAGEFRLTESGAEGTSFLHTFTVQHPGVHTGRHH